MDYNIDEIFAKPVFADISTERVEMFKEMYGRMNGKPPMEMLAIMSEYMPRIREGTKLTPPEQQAMLEAMYSCMSEKESETLKALLKFIN
jgi:hypothetical protein